MSGHSCLLFFCRILQVDGALERMCDLAVKLAKIAVLFLILVKLLYNRII